VSRALQVLFSNRVPRSTTVLFIIIILWNIRRGWCCSHRRIRFFFTMQSRRLLLFLKRRTRVFKTCISKIRYQNKTLLAKYWWLDFGIKHYRPSIDLILVWLYSCPNAYQRFILYYLHFSARLSFGFVKHFFLKKWSNKKHKE